MAYEIIAVRTEMSDDLSHEHVELVGYASPHIVGEAIMIPVPRLIQRLAFGDKFFMSVNGEQAEITAAKCPTCGHEPGLKTSADKAGTQHLLALPRT